MIEFQWTISLGQTIILFVFAATLAASYAVMLSKYAQSQRRIAVLEEQVAAMRAEIEQLTELLTKVHP